MAKARRSRQTRILETYLSICEIESASAAIPPLQPPGGSTIRGIGGKRRQNLRMRRFWLRRASSQSGHVEDGSRPRRKEVEPPNQPSHERPTKGPLPPPSFRNYRASNY